MRIEDIANADAGKKLLNRICTLKAQLQNLDTVSLIQFKSGESKREVVHDIPLGANHYLEPLSREFLESIKGEIKVKIKTLEKEFEDL